MGEEKDRTIAKGLCVPDNMGTLRFSQPKANCKNQFIGRNRIGQREPGSL